MMKRSFYENSKFSNIPKIQKKLIISKNNLTNLKEFDCHLRQGLEEYPIISYDELKRSLRQSNFEFFNENSGSILRNNPKITFPSFIVILNKYNDTELGVLLSINMNLSDKSDRYFKVLTIERINEKKKIELEYENEKEEFINYSRNHNIRLKIREITAENIITVFEDKFESQKSFGNFKTIQNFSKEIKIMQDLAEELIKKSESFKEEIIHGDFKKSGKQFSQYNFKTDTEELKNSKNNKFFFLKEMIKNKCHNCPKKYEHIKQMYEKNKSE